MIPVATIYRNTSVLKKVFKLFGYFLLFIGLGYQTQRLYKKLKVEPEIFSKESSIQSSQIPFPAVTFCPTISVKREAWKPKFLRLNNLTINDLRGASLQICSNHDLYMAYKVSDMNVVDVLLKSALNYTDIFSQCGLNKYKLFNQDCERLFVKSVTDYGICYTFNMLGHESVFNRGTSSDFDTFKRTKISKSWDAKDVMDETRHENDTEPPEWSAEVGYLRMDEHVQPARALKMQTLFIGASIFTNETFCDEREKNYKVLLHLPNELPQISYETLDIPLGFVDHILISAEVMEYEDSLKNFPPDKRGCYFEGEMELRLFKSYTKANCEYECMINFVYLTCGCVKFSMPRTKNMKVCGFDQSSCIWATTSTFPRSYYEDHENMRKYPEYPCGCLPSCTEIKYKVIKNEIKNLESGYLKDTYMYTELKVIFASSQIKKTSNYVTYEMENFIFDVGGLIGLFLGSSILSILELLVGVFRTIRNYAETITRMLRSRKPEKQPELEPTGSIAIISIQELETEELDVEDLESCEEVST